MPPSDKVWILAGSHQHAVYVAKDLGLGRGEWFAGPKYGHRPRAVVVYETYWERRDAVAYWADSVVLLAGRSPFHFMTGDLGITPPILPLMSAKETLE